ncbi:hypothetical protein ACSHWF_04350 [Aerococcus urinaeequi]|uniref:hypothetical protein n=1 Tax=Aerococcus urinaeequi TaxID=51665 RepID=UPI003D6A2213
MDHSEDLLEKVGALPEEYQNITIKLLDYIGMDQYSRSQIQNLIREDIRELVLEDGLDDSE